MFRKTIVHSLYLLFCCDTFLAQQILVPQNVRATFPSTFTIPYDSFRIAANNFPQAQEFQGTATSTFQTIVGAVDGPSGATPAAVMGIAGYARTNFANTLGGTAAVGGFFAGYSGVTPTGSNVMQEWGINTVVNNCPGSSCTDGQGATNGNSYGIEIDVNMFKAAGNVAAANAIGLWVTGGSTHHPAGIADALRIGLLGAYTGISWNNALETLDGSAVVGALFGASQGGGTFPSGCTPIRLRSYSAGGSAYYQQITCDQFGNLIFLPGAAGQVVLEDSNGNAGLALTPSGSTPYISINSQLRVGTGSVLIPSIESISGQRFVCITTAGQLVSSATACSGT